MSRSGSCRTGLAVAASLLVALAMTPAWAAAADDPLGAVEEFFAVLDSGDYLALEPLVCEAERDSLREGFGPMAELGLAADELGGSIALRIDDRTLELVSEEAETATVHVTGTMRFDLATDDLEAFLRTMIESEMGEDVSEEDVAAMLPFMQSLFEQSTPIDQDIEVVLEDGQWLMCGELGDGANDPAGEPSVSTDGLCAFVSPEELDGLSELAYDSSAGFETYCSYYPDLASDYHGVSVTFHPGQEVERIAGDYGADQPLEIGGLPALASGPEAFGNDLFTQLGDDVLQVSFILPASPPEGFDWQAHAAAVTELFLPHVEEMRLAFAGQTGQLDQPTPPPIPTVSLCEMVTLEIVNEATGLAFDEASGDPWFCGYYSLDAEPGFHSVTLSISEMSLADYATFFTGTTETSVGEAAALEAPGQLLVQLPDSSWLLMVSGFLDPSDKSLTFTDAEMLRQVAELALARVVPPDA